jgi:ankyrin repeat protein
MEIDMEILKPTQALEKRNLSSLIEYIEEYGVDNEGWFLSNNSSPLMLTLLYKKYLSYEVSKELIKHFDINHRDKDGNTVLFLAVMLGNLPAIKFFIANGGDVSLKNNTGKKASDYAETFDIHNGLSVSRLLLTEEKRKK